MCGIVGIVSEQEVGAELHDSLLHLQHRGQNSAGIITEHKKRFHHKLGEGLVNQVFTPQNIGKLKGNRGIGHVRYPTSGSDCSTQIQPFQLNVPFKLALAHNGNLINHHKLRDELLQVHKMPLNSDSDSEILLAYFAVCWRAIRESQQQLPFFDQLCQAVGQVLQKIKGGYSVIGLLHGHGIFAFRDKYGIRPLTIGERHEESGFISRIISSETTPFLPQRFRQSKSGDVLPGELVWIKNNGDVIRRRLVADEAKPCVFEYVYFARPDSVINNISVYRSRLRMGEALANTWLKKHPAAQPDVVIPVPFTSNVAAQAFAAKIKVRYSEGLYKNPFIGRTFIMSSQAQRRHAVRNKLSPQFTEISQKNVLLLDDSIVRGTTSREIVQMVREMGAKKVFFVSAAPPIKHPCYYGIDIPTKKRLIASSMDEEELKRYLDVDLLLYQELASLADAVVKDGRFGINNLCMACMDGKYIDGIPQL